MLTRLFSKRLLLPCLFILPCTYAYLTATSHGTQYSPPSCHLIVIASTWCLIECLFYLYFIHTKQRLQSITKPERLLTKIERAALFRQCINTIKDFQAWCEGWFYYRTNYTHPSIHQIHRQNIAQWLAWAFWHDHLEHVQKEKAWAEELEWMIREAEDRFSYQFPDGLNPDVECIRLNLDPVNAVHRPLLAYVGIYLITQCFNLVGLQWCWGFTPSHSTTHSWGGPIQLLDHLYQSLFNLASHQPKDKITYWYRAPTDGQRKTPIVFVHGIGIGVLSYAEWISLLLSRLSDRPIFLVELPYVAMRMVDTVPTATETTKEVRQMLNQYGYDKAVYVSHSLGTAVTSWIIKLAPDTVAGTVMIDPICFLLHYHHVAFNFVHRLPKQLIEYLMYYGASREMYISYYISRHFQWFESICFVEHIQKTTLNNMAVFLSEKDRIVGSEDVYHYLLEHGINTYVMKGLEHAMFLINRKWKNTIIHQIETISSKTD